MITKIGVHLGYWREGVPPQLWSTLQRLAQSGVESVWTSEAYGSDAFGPLAWVGATMPFRLGTSIAQISARSAAATAMAAMTLDHLSGGRVVLGLGVSGPEVVERWHGDSFAQPLRRTREYVATVREAASGHRLTSTNRHPRLALRSTLRPFREHLPILLAAQGPQNIALAAEIADGWIATHYAPSAAAFYAEALAAGFGRRLTQPEGFEVVARVPIAVADDIEVAADQLRPRLAREIAVMGPPGRNFHFNSYVRLGFGEACETIRDLYRAGQTTAAAAAVPTALVDSIALLGSLDRITQRLRHWHQGPATTLVLSGASEDVVALAGALSQRNSS